MKIGIITLSRRRYEKGKFYNDQDLGLARAFADLKNDVFLYRLVKIKSTEEIPAPDMDGTLQMIYKKAAGLEKQSYTKLDFLRKDLDCLICFSDNQILFPQIYKWCKKYKTALYPYIGVLQSNSDNRIKQAIMNLITKKNLRLYRQLTVFGKTPYIIREMKALGIQKTVLAPVGLDKSLLKENFMSEDKDELRKKYGYSKSERVILFIGRLEQEKEPLKLIEIFKTIYDANQSFRLLIVGKGILESDVRNRIEQLELQEAVQIFSQIPNKHIWELYYISEYFLNLNSHEIYGMSILEAMYYQSLVIAVKAPGPEYILQHNVTGFLCEDVYEIPHYVLKEQTDEQMLECAREHIETKFLWDKVINSFQIIQMKKDSEARG